MKQNQLFVIQEFNGSTVSIFEKQCVMDNLKFNQELKKNLYSKKTPN